jgi:hypothetical protein
MRARSVADAPGAVKLRRKENRMSDLIPFPDGGCAFLKGVFPYSAGVVALPGFAIERARFARPLPMLQGFEKIANHLKSIGRPLTALCAAELRSPKPFSFGGFSDFNQSYVAPEIDPPTEPSFYAFCYTVPSNTPKSFVVAGSGEWPEGGRDAGLHGARPASFPRRRDPAPRRRARGTHLALLPSADCWAGVRDGFARGCRRAHDMMEEIEV